MLNCLLLHLLTIISPSGSILPLSPAEEVIIKTKTKNIIISAPEVMITDMMGKEVYQISGEVSEAGNINEDDVKMIMEKTGKDRETVVKKLEELDNDLAKAIMELKE